jgi:hypothetical protein
MQCAFFAQARQINQFEFSLLRLTVLTVSADVVPDPIRNTKWGIAEYDQKMLAMWSFVKAIEKVKVRWERVPHYLHSLGDDCLGTLTRRSSAAVTNDQRRRGPAQSEAA